MDYLFVYINDNWYLKISSVNELINYYKSKGIMDKWTKEYINLVNSKEFCNGTKHCNEIGMAIGMLGVREGLTPFEATNTLIQEIFNNQLELLLQGYDLYINAKGGYFMDKEKPYIQWYRKNTIDFPYFTKDQIRIKRFPMGTHYYAYIGNMQVYDGDINKWDSYKAAFDYATKYLTQKENT